MDCLVLDWHLLVVCGRDEELVLNVDKVLAVSDGIDVRVGDGVLNGHIVTPFGATSAELHGKSRAHTDIRTARRCGSVMAESVLICVFVCVPMSAERVRSRQGNCVFKVNIHLLAILCTLKILVAFLYALLHAFSESTGPSTKATIAFTFIVHESS